MRKHSRLPKPCPRQGTAAEIKHSQNKKHKNFSPSDLQLSLLPMEAHLILPLENFAQTSRAAGIAPFLTGAFPRSHQRQSPSPAADQATLGTEKGQDWSNLQIEGKQRWTRPRDHLHRFFWTQGLRRSQQTCTYDLRERLNEIINSGDSICVRQLLLSPFIWVKPGMGEPCICSTAPSEQGDKDQDK